MRTSLALLILLGAAPAGSADRPKDAKALARATAGRSAGAPIDCITRSRTEEFQVAGRHLIFHLNSGITYINEVSPGCEAGGPRQTLVFRSASSRLCRGEIALSVDPLGGAAGGSCALGRFVPYERP